MTVSDRLPPVPCVAPAAPRVVGDVAAVHEALQRHRRGVREVVPVLVVVGDRRDRSGAQDGGVAVGADEVVAVLLREGGRQPVVVEAADQRWLVEVDLVADREDEVRAVQAGQAAGDHAAPARLVAAAVEARDEQQVERRPVPRELGRHRPHRQLAGDGRHRPGRGRR